SPCCSTATGATVRPATASSSTMVSSGRWGPAPAGPEAMSCSTAGIRAATTTRCPARSTWPATAATATSPASDPPGNPGDHRSRPALPFPGRTMVQGRPVTAWGPGTFDNETALDWLGDLELADADYVRDALAGVAEAHDADELDAHAYRAALAAAEIVAAARGRALA